MVKKCMHSEKPTDLNEFQCKVLDEKAGFSTYHEIHPVYQTTFIDKFNPASGKIEKIPVTVLDHYLQTETKRLECIKETPNSKIFVYASQVCTKKLGNSDARALTGSGTQLEISGLEVCGPVKIEK